MKILPLLSRVLMALSVFLLLVTMTLGITFNSRWLYISGFNKYDVSAKLGISEPEVERFASELIAYFNDRHQEYLDIDVTFDNGLTGPLYNEADILHMKDVKRLLWLNYEVAFASLAYIVLFVGGLQLRNRDKLGIELAQGVFRGGLITLTVLISLGFIAVLNFDGFFNASHRLLFPQGNWYFPPWDPMTIMFPHEFWEGMVLRVIIIDGILGLLIAGVGGFMLKRMKWSGRIIEFK
ncbi:MAG: DUF1461 domain-containing protein [Dehalococcoidia bacterium]|nr:DUF1461 domain-containing protein [Dehalococcoidia bacterium]